MAEGSTLRQRYTEHPTAPPPSYEECVGVADSADPDVPPLSHDEARKALLRHLNKQWFSNKAPAIECDFVNIHSTSAYRYELETFTESRSVSWAHEPYTGQRLDTAERGEELEMWAITVTPPAMFEEEEERKVEVAHTASQETCQHCNGVAQCQCWKCRGSGGVQCASCKGSGQVPKATPTETQAGGSMLTCGLCRGSGTESCSTCKGKGQMACEMCSGAGRVKTFKELTISWKVQSVDRVVELTGLDHTHLRKAQARPLLQEESLQAEPIRDCPIPCMKLASEELVYSHSTISPDTKTLMQRQTISLIPVHEVTAQWNERQFRYWVFGYDNSAHCPEYPNKCDCDCTLL